ncbi:predicted protein [Naegleria gruberi]|uniref:Predicted protein n=1 Tax=Naegleria gruberi TaxID=5762 RepID=D2VYM1_NAEGR|nr:uncharacterized protein NAEGRDRAFT_59602 [Naegleria gruberi]EFC38081.1 predicted protein [Naegleria gruberi]|eukprot:XP_002670825.1 predicted protein [Naegleria gruberi strain NEG-M]
MNSQQIQKPQPIRTINNNNNTNSSTKGGSSLKFVVPNNQNNTSTIENQSTNNISSEIQGCRSGVNGHGCRMNNPPSSPSSYVSYDTKTPSSCTVHVTYLNATSPSSPNNTNNTCVATTTTIQNTNASNGSTESSFKRFPISQSPSVIDPAVTMQDHYFHTTIKTENAQFKNKCPSVSPNNTTPSTTPNSYSNTFQDSSVNPPNDSKPIATSQLSHPYNTSYHNNSNQSSLNSPFETTTHVEYPTMQHLPTLCSINPTQTTPISSNSQQAQTTQSSHLHVNHQQQTQQKQIPPNSYAARLFSMNNNNIHHHHQHHHSTTINPNNIINNSQSSPNSSSGGGQLITSMNNNSNITMNSHHQQQQPQIMKSDLGMNNNTCGNSSNNNSTTASMSSLPTPQPIPIMNNNKGTTTINHQHDNSMLPSPIMMTTSSFPQYNSMPMNVVANNSTHQIITTTVSATTCGERHGDNSPTTCGHHVQLSSLSNINPSNSSSSLSSSISSGHVKSNTTPNNILESTPSSHQQQQQQHDGYSSTTSSSSMSLKACSSSSIQQQNDDLSISSQQPERKKKRVNPPPPIMNSTTGHHLPPFIPIQPHPSLTPTHRNPPSPNMHSQYQQFAKIVPFGGMSQMPNVVGQPQPPPHGMPVPFYHSFTPFPTPITPTGIPPRMSNSNIMNATPSPTTPVPLASSPQGDAISSSSSNSDDSSSNTPTNSQQQSASAFPTSTPSSHYSYEIVIPGDSCSTIIKLNVGLTLDKFHDIRMKKTIFEAFIENQKTVNDGRSGISNETQKISTWRLKQVEIIKNICFFRFKLLDDGKPESPTVELDKNGYEINGNALAKVCESGPSRLAFSLDSYGKRVSKRLHKEKLVTCPFLITLTNGTKDFVKCVCVHLCINKRQKKTVITRADFDTLLRDKSYMVSLISIYASSTKKKPLDEESLSSDEDEQPLKILKRDPSGSAHTELRLKHGPGYMVSINNVTLRYPFAGVDPGPVDNWRVSLKGSEGEIDCQVLSVSTVESESSSSFSTVSIFFELPIISTKVSVLVVKYKNIEQSSNAAFYMIDDK